MFQTIGIALGSWWAYYELGWGGWWFWDPVENASFMPWLVGTALIHSLSVTEKRGIFKSWTLLLAIFAFSLSLVGTFLVRSGVLVSVHSFATDPKRGLYILAFLVVTIGGSLSLYAWRAPKLYAPGGFEFLSREFFLLINNVILVGVAGLVLWGTLSPLVYEMLGIGKISVGPPVFALMFLVPMLPLMGFLAVGMHSAWRRGKLTVAAKPLWWMGVAAILLSVAIQGLVFRQFHLVGLIGFSFGFWVMLSSLLEPVRRLRQRQTLGAALLGMCIAHFGVGVFAIGASGVESYKIEKDVALKPGGSFAIAGYDFKFITAADVRGPNYDAVQAVVEVRHEGRLITTLLPQKRHFWVQQTDNSQAAISVGRAICSSQWATRSARMRGACAFNTSPWCATSGWARSSWRSAVCWRPPIAAIASRSRLRRPRSLRRRPMWNLNPGRHDVEVSVAVRGLSGADRAVRTRLESQARHS
jgi:cytochrome c-type biogenesis protein CcmF